MPHPPELIIKRHREYSPPLSEVLPKITQLISEWQSTSPLCNTGSRSKTRKQIELTEAGISEYMRWLEERWDQGSSIPFCLFDRWKSPSTFLSISYSKFFPLQRLKLIIDPAFPRSTLELDRFFSLISELCTILGASTAYIYDYGVACYNATYNIHPDTFDIHNVPYGIWWINYWSKMQVETIGRSKISSANWARIVELTNGAMLVAVTEEMMDVGMLKHLEKIKQLSEYFNLREIQKDHLTNEHTYDTPG
jgi:hypothetical protein